MSPFLPEFRSVRGPAAGWPYEVDQDGNVRHAETGRELTPYAGGPEGQYHRVDMRRDGERKQVYVHQLVAWTFLPGDPTGKVVDHRDENPTNNSAENLRYLSSEENMERGR